MMDLYHKVPTDANQLSDIKLSLNDSLLLKRNVESITTKCVIDAISKLKQDKSDSSGLNTNHFRLGGNRLAVYLGLLYTSMLVHGYTVDELLFSTVVPIPKNPRASLSDSNNYRGIALCSCLSKILDTIILTKYNHLLCSSDLQFAYKEKLGTTMCTLILKQDAHTKLLLLISKGNDLKRGGTYNKRASVVCICPKKGFYTRKWGDSVLVGRFLSHHK